MGLLRRTGSELGCALAPARDSFLGKSGSVKNALCDLNTGSILHLVGLWKLNRFTVFAFCRFLPLLLILTPKEIGRE